LALASSGDNLDDANFDLTTVNAAILKLSELEQWIQTTMKNINSFREKGQGDEKDIFYDQIFENEMNSYIQKIEQAYE
jgi:leucyl-tRNA synthetase